MEKILPIGSLVYLTEGNQKLMILSRGVFVDKGGEKILFDYSASLYPQGLNPDQIYYFNQEDIDKVIYEGYSDHDELRFVELYREWLETNSSLISTDKTD